MTRRTPTQQHKSRESSVPTAEQGVLKRGFDVGMQNPGFGRSCATAAGIEVAGEGRRRVKGVERGRRIDESPFCSSYRFASCSALFSRSLSFRTNQCQSNFSSDSVAYTVSLRGLRPCLPFRQHLSLLLSRNPDRESITAQSALRAEWNRHWRSWSRRRRSRGRRRSSG